MEQHNITVRLAPDTVAILDSLAASQERDRSYLIKQAVADYVALHRWQIDEINAGIAEADAGLFTPADQMERLYAKWTA